MGPLVPSSPIPSRGAPVKGPKRPLLGTEQWGLQCRAPSDPEIPSEWKEKQEHPGSPRLSG